MTTQNQTSRQLGPLRRRSWLLLMVVCIAVYGINLGGTHVLSNHEIDVAGGARQMIAEGDWLTPKIGDHPWLERPPLLHWLVASSILFFGKTTEWVVRLPSVAAGMILVIVVATMVGRWKGERAGLLAGFIQCTSGYMINFARLAEADILLACMVTGAITVFIHLQGIGLAQPARRPRPWAILFWVLIGLTNLVKGPLFGIAMTMAPCLAWLLWKREKEAWKKLWTPTGLLLGFIIAVAWYALMWLKHPEAIDLWLTHTLRRAVGDFDYDGRPWWYYWERIPLKLLPWTFATVFGVIPSLKRMWRDSRSPDRLVWLWALVPICLLTLSRGRSHQYMLASLPGFTLVTTIGLLKIKQQIQEVSRPVVAVAWTSMAVLAPAGWVAGLVAGLRLPEYRVDAWIISVLLGSGFLLMGLFARRGRADRAFATFLLMIVLGWMQANLHFIPSQDTRRPDRQFLATLHAYLPPQALLFATGGEEIARHIFYVKPPLIGVWYPEDIGQHLGEAEDFYVAGRMWHKDVLGDFGKVSILYQSEYTRGENSKQDRFTLFRIQRTEFSKSNPSGNGPQPLGQAMDAGTPAEQTGKGTS